MMASAANINELGGYTLNPRGNLWLNDESKFGQKMLMKMGWSKGKGLGKNENGIKENVKVKFKCTNEGLGYKDQLYDDVMKGEYESILRNLSAEYSQKNHFKKEDESKKHKQKSKAVKRKIRYPKLFYGKDVSKYSEKDMKHIFLFSLPSHENEDEEIKSNNSVSSCLADSKKELPKLLDSYNSRLSVSDYFTLKMEEKKGFKIKKERSNEINEGLKINKEPSNEINEGIKIKKEPSNEINEGIKIKKEPSNEIDEGIKIKKEPSNEIDEGIKVKNEPSNEINEDSSNVLSNETENTLVKSDRKKNKKRKKKSADSNVDLSNLDENDTECKLSHEKRRKICEDLHPEGHSDVNNFEMINSDQNSQSITPSKKKKRSHKLDDITCTKNSTNDCDSSSSAISPPNKKRKKLQNTENCGHEESVELLSVNALKQRTSNENGDVHTLYLNEKETQHNSNNSKSQKSVKLKNKLKTLKSCLKSKRDKFTLKNVSFSENVSYKIIDSCFEADSETPICIDIDCEDLVSQETDNSNELQKDSTDSQNESFNAGNGNNDICSNTVEANCTDETACDDNEHYVTDFPSSKASHYNSWIESQKLALKMKMYKSMLKNIKKHEVLKTTNMLSIQGYGNWGFK